MRVMKFEGATMRDAIAKVKAELGDHAVIIASRQVRRGLLGSAVEISAAIDSDDDHAPSFNGPTSGGPTAPPQPQQRTGEEVEKAIAPLRSEMRSLRALVRTAGENRSTTEMRAELTALRQLVEQIHRVGKPTAEPAPARAQAQPQGHSHAKPAAPAVKPAASRQGVAKGTAAPHRASAYDQPLTAASTGHIVMLVGPTGAGKTTTIAKLATRAALIDGRRVGLITLDNYRVGGVDQIRTFADLIGVPLAVADAPSDLSQLIDPAHDLTLIDTAGKSPRDKASIEELARHMEGLDIEVHLVVPAGASAAQVDELTRRYAPLAPSRLLFTKVDECESAPELALAPARTGLPITWVTTGQQVPEDIEQPSAVRVLELASCGLGDAATGTSGPTPNRSRRAA